VYYVVVDTTVRLRRRATASCATVAGADAPHDHESQPTAHVVGVKVRAGRALRGEMSWARVWILLLSVRRETAELPSPNMHGCAIYINYRYYHMDRREYRFD